MVASSLALALGASVAVAEPTITAGNAANSMKPVTTLTDLKWATVDGLSAPSTDGTVANINTLNFTFVGNTQGITGAGDSANSSYTATIGAQDNNHFKFTSTQGLKMGDGTGTLNVHMGVMGTTRSFTLNLGKNTAGYSLMGNLTLFAGKDNGKFDATFQGSVKGNITIDGDGNKHQSINFEPHSFTFENGANIEGNIDVILGKNTFIFKGKHTVGQFLSTSVAGDSGVRTTSTFQINNGANVEIDSITTSQSNRFASVVKFKGETSNIINNATINIKRDLNLDVTQSDKDLNTEITLNGGRFSANGIKTHGPSLTISVENNGAFEVGTGGIVTRYGHNSFKAPNPIIGGDVIVDHSNGDAGSVSITADQSLMINGAIKNDQGGVNITIGGNNQSNRIANGILLNHNTYPNTGTKTITLKQTGASKTTIGTLKNADGSDSGLSLKMLVGKTDIILAPLSELILEGGIYLSNAYGNSVFNVKGEKASLDIGGIQAVDHKGLLGLIDINVGRLIIRGDLNARPNITLNGGDSRIEGNIDAPGSLKANFTLNSASLTLNGDTNQISTLAATGSRSTLIISKMSNSNIDKLILGSNGANGATATNGNLALNVAGDLNVTNLSVANNTEGKINLNNGNLKIVNPINLSANQRISLSIGGNSTPVSLELNGGDNTITSLSLNKSGVVRYDGNLIIDSVENTINEGGTFIATTLPSGSNTNTTNLLTINSGSGTYGFATLGGNDNLIGTKVAVTKKSITLKGGDNDDELVNQGITLKPIDNQFGFYDWIIASVSPTIKETPLERSQDISASFLNVYLANFNSLNKRMGELRENKNGQGAWGRIFNGQENNKFSNSSTNFTTIQAGYDYAFGLGEGVTNYLGAALSYGFGSSGFDQTYGSLGKTSDMTSHLVEFALYNSYVQDEGWFNDTIIKFGSLMNNISSTGLDVKTNSFAFTFSDEVGYRFKLGSEKEWFIDPQFELGMGHLADAKFDHISASGKVQASADSMFVLRTRLGASAGYDFKKLLNGNSIKASAYVGLFAEIDSFNGGDITLASTNAKVLSRNAKTSFKSTDARGVINYGGNVAVKDNIRVYLDMEHSFGGQISTDYKINAGVRYSFGEKTQFLDAKAQEKKDEAKKKEETPIKLKEEEKKNTQEQAKDVKKETKAQEKQTTSETSKNEKAEAKKTESKKADAKAGKKQTKKQVTKKGTAKKQVKKAEANKAKSANKTAQTEGRKGGDWGWW